MCTPSRTATSSDAQADAVLRQALGVACMRGALATGTDDRNRGFRPGEQLARQLRHGRPSNVRITMADDMAHWVLAVSDDGVGMEQHAALAGEGFGLTSMQQRAGAIGGEWHIESKPGAGTRVSVRVPKRRV